MLPASARVPDTFSGNCSRPAHSSWLERISIRDMGSRYGKRTRAVTTSRQITINAFMPSILHNPIPILSVKNLAKNHKPNSRSFRHDQKKSRRPTSPFEPHHSKHLNCDCLPSPFLNTLGNNEHTQPHSAAAGTLPPSTFRRITAPANRRPRLVSPMARHAPSAQRIYSLGRNTIVRRAECDRGLGILVTRLRVLEERG